MPNRPSRNRPGGSTIPPLPQPDNEDVRMADDMMLKLAEYTNANGRDAELLSDPSPQVPTGKLKVKQIILEMIVVEEPPGQKDPLPLEHRIQIRAVTSELTEARRRAG